MKTELIVNDQPKAPVSEVFRILRTNIQFLAKKENSMKIIAVTSTDMSDGKSWITVNLATAFAQSGNRVIVIDADLRKGRLDKVFNSVSTIGLSNYLASRDTKGVKAEINLENCIQKTRIDNLCVITTGTVSDNPSELLLNTKMKECLDILSKACDIVIVDTPPVGIVTDGLILARIVDGVLTVAQQNKTSMDALRKAVNDIEHVGGTVIGTVLNKVNVSKKKYDRKYYYSKNKAKKPSRPGY